VNGNEGGWHKAQGRRVSRARKNIEQKGVSEDINEQIQKQHSGTMKNYKRG
jgi:hypothetical protein